MICIRVVMPARIETGGNVMNIRTKIAPAINSTSGYCHEILLLHFRHAPFCATKLKIGTSSFHVRVLPQDMHMDRPPSPLPVFHRKATTLRKLPTMAPKTNERTSEGLSMKKIGNYQRLLSGADAVVDGGGNRGIIACGKSNA